MTGRPRERLMCEERMDAICGGNLVQVVQTMDFMRYRKQPRNDDSTTAMAFVEFVHSDGYPHSLAGTVS